LVSSELKKRKGENKKKKKTPKETRDNKVHEPAVGEPRDKMWGGGKDIKTKTYRSGGTIEGNQGGGGGEKRRKL